MTNVLDRLPSGARVAIIRLRSLGDCVLTTPALALLKQARPDLRVAVVVEDPFRAVFAGNPDVDQILGPNAGSLSRFRPHLALNLHGGATSVRLMLAAASSLRAGFGHFRFQPIYNLRIPRAQEILEIQRKVHTAEHLASAMFYLGVHQSEIPRARLFATASPGRDPTPSCIRSHRPTIRPGRGKTSCVWRNIWKPISGWSLCSSRVQTKIYRASANIPAFKAHPSKR